MMQFIQLGFKLFQEREIVFIHAQSLPLIFTKSTNRLNITNDFRCPAGSTPEHHTTALVIGQSNLQGLFWQFKTSFVT